MLSLPELKSDQHGYEQYYQTLTVRREHHPECPNASPYLSPCDTAKFSVSIVVFLSDFIRATIIFIVLS